MNAFNSRYLLTFFLLMGICTITFGCTQRQAQTTVQTSLTALAHGLDATSEVAAEQLGDAPIAARQKALAARQEHPSLTVDEAMEIYREELDRWYALSRALTTAHHVLLLGQSAVDIWIDTGELPQQWAAFCEDVGEVFSRLMPMLEELEIDVPTLLQQSVPYADTICEVAGAFFTRQE